MSFQFNVALLSSFHGVEVGGLGVGVF